MHSQPRCQCPISALRPIDFPVVDNSGQISAPGSLQAGAVIAPDAPRVPDQDLGELARQHGLKLSGARPSLASYLAMLWQRRHFIVGYATARNVSMYTDAKLGQIWQVLTPLLNAGVYYLIFGLLFEAARGVAQLPGVPGRRRVRVRVHRAVDRHRLQRDAREPAADPGALLPARLAAARLRDRRAAADARRHGRARRHHAGQRGVSELVLAAASSRPCCCRRCSTSGRR